MNQIKSNILGGVTAAIIALPLALAFGVASGAGAIAGLYGAIILGFFASLFGGTPTQISGPTGPMTVVMASTVTLFHDDFNAVMSVVFLAGIFQIIFALIKLGKYVKYIPYPVISGFMNGIGVIIIIIQLNPLLGLQSKGSVFQSLSIVLESFSHINIEAVFIALLTLIIMFFTPKKVTQIIPSALIALIFVTTMSIGFHLNVQTIGDIPNSFPSFVFPSFELTQLKQIVIMALTLSLLGSIDTLLTSLVADSITKTKHNSNKELIGQGIGNTLVSFFGGIPGAGATMRTVVNIKSGGTTKLSGMIHALTLLIIIIFLSPLASQIPLALLAGILMKVGIDILDYKFLKVIKAVPKHDLIVMLSVFFLTVFVDLIIAVSVGIVFSSLLIVYRLSSESKIKINFHKERSDSIHNKDIKILNIDGAFFFGSTSLFQDKINEVLDTKKLIINCSNVPFMDISAIFTLEEMIIKLQDLDIKITLVLKKRHIQKLKQVDKMNIFENIHITKSLREALNTQS